MKTGYWARKLYERLSDHQVDRIFDIIESHGIDEALSKAEELSFDWHSKVVLRMMADKSLAKAMMAIKIPWGREKKVVNS